MARRAIRHVTVMLLGMTTTAILLGGQAEHGTAGWRVPDREAQRKNPIAMDSNSVARGRATFARNCQSCHGPTGKGDGPKATDLRPKPSDLSSPVVARESDGTLFWKITEGRKPMPAFRKLASDDDRWHVVNYIRTLSSRSAPSPNP